MKRIYHILLFRSMVLIVIGCGPLISLGQNLVYNPSFEEYSECPDDLNQMFKAAGWNRYRGSPDYFNACSESIITGVPLNHFGFQQAATGSAYAGARLLCDFPSNTREHLGSLLLEPLIIGMQVFISFRVSPASGGVLINHILTSNNAGVRFALEPYLHNQVPPLPNNAALHMTEVPTDTTIWYTVSGIYVPDSAYQCIVVGNFFDDATTNTATLNPDGNLECSYVYFDDICVSYDPLVCGISVSIDKGGASASRFHIYPNPFSDQFTIKLPQPLGHPLQLVLYDQLGRPHWSGSVPAGSVNKEFLVPDLALGLYYVMPVRTVYPFTPVPVLCSINNK